MQRDLFEAKLKRKPLSVWEEGAASCGQDYDKSITYIKRRFLDKNRDPAARQVYVHATCATDTDNVKFVMESVFDIILKDNLRKMAKVDVSALVEVANGSSGSTVKIGPDVWAPSKAGKLLLACCWYTDELQESSILVKEGSIGHLPAVQLSETLYMAADEWKWVQGLGKDMPDLRMNDKLAGSFKGNVIEGSIALKNLMGVEKATDLGSIYDQQIVMDSKSGHKTTVILLVKRCRQKPAAPAGYMWVQHEAFENACYKEFAGVDTDKKPCEPPPKNVEFNPFAPNPTGHR